MISTSDTKEKDQYFDFIEPEDQNELKSFGILEEKKYIKDGISAVADPALLPNNIKETTNQQWVFFQKAYFLKLANINR